MKVIIISENIKNQIEKIYNKCFQITCIIDADNEFVLPQSLIYDENYFEIKNLIQDLPTKDFKEIKYKPIEPNGK